MAFHANFAAVLGINQANFQDMIRLSYLAGKVPHVIQVNTEAMGLLQFNTDFFCDAPEITLSGNEPNSILLRIDLRGG